MENTSTSEQGKNEKAKSHIFWWILGIVMIATVGIWFASTREEESNIGAGNRNSLGNANALVNIASVSTDGWKNYEVSEYGISVQIPSDWMIKKERIQSGSFQTNEPLAEHIIEPAEPYIFSEALEWIGPESRQCFLIASSLGLSSLPEWIERADIYVPTGDEGLNIQKQQEVKINGIPGILIEEGGPNAQQSYSFFFNVKNTVLRYGFYGLRGARPTEDCAKYGQICNAILNTLESL